MSNKAWLFGIILCVPLIGFCVAEGMRWSQHGAHLLLQVRTRVLNDELREVFRQWYPNFDQGDEDQRLAA